MRTATLFVLATGMGLLAPCLAGTTPEPAAVDPAPVLLPATVVPQDAVPAAMPGAAPESPRSFEGVGPAVDLQRLESQRGGESLVVNDVEIAGTVSGNLAEGTNSGSNHINDGAFANAAGISTVIQNTGNNVLIQNGMVVNIQFVAPIP